MQCSAMVPGINVEGAYQVTQAPEVISSQPFIYGTVYFSFFGLRLRSEPECFYTALAWCRVPSKDLHTLYGFQLQGH